MLRTVANSTLSLFVATQAPDAVVHALVKGMCVPQPQIFIFSGQREAQQQWDEQQRQREAQRPIQRAAHWEQEGSKWRKAEQTASSSSTATRAYVKMFRDKRTAEEAGLDEADKSHAMMMGELNSLCESLGTSPVHIKEMFNPGNFADKATNLGLQVVPRTSEPAGTSICNLIARPHGNSGKLSNRSYLLDHPCVHPSRKFIH